jgi:multiple sugar transport system ATP-binding protein
LAEEGEPALLEGQVSVIEPLGSETLIYVDIGQREVVATVQGRILPKLGEKVRLNAPQDEIHFFDSDSEIALKV